MQNKNIGEIPFYLRNAVTEEMAEQLNYGQGYKYAHDYPNAIAPLEFMPSRMEGTVYYEPTNNGYEKNIKSWLDKIRSILNEG